MEHAEGIGKVRIVVKGCEHVQEASITAKNIADGRRLTVAAGREGRQEQSD